MGLGPAYTGEAGPRVSLYFVNVWRAVVVVETVATKIRQVLMNQKPVAIVSAAACGADLLLLDVAGEMHVPRYVLLPSEPEEFRVSSVADRPGNWDELYSKALRTSKVQVLNCRKGSRATLRPTWSSSTASN